MENHIDTPNNNPQIPEKLFGIPTRFIRDRCYGCDSAGDSFYACGLCAERGYDAYDGCGNSAQARNEAIRLGLI